MPIVVLALLAPAVSLAQDEELAAHNLVSQQRFSEARTLYRRLSERNPDNLDYQVWIARLSAWLKEYGTAVEGYDRVLSRDTHNTEALVGKAYVFMWLGRYVEAGETLALAEQTAPENGDVQVAQARLARYQGHDRDARARVSAALKVDPDNAEAKDLRAEIGSPHPMEVRMSYGQDRFSFAEAGNAGTLSASYLGESNRAGLQYEEWSRFGERVRRGGANFTKKWNGRWWLRASAMWGPGALSVPRQEYTAGFSRTLPRRFVFDADYRYLGFHTARVHVAAPALSYYLARPSWVQATLFNSWTMLAPGSPYRMYQGVLIQYFHQVAKPLVLHAGYARGTESFTALSIDRLGLFAANTFLAGSDWKITRAYAVGLFGAYQTRSNGERQTSFGVNLTVRP